MSETIDEIFWVVEPDWSDFIYVNPAYEEIVGRSRDVLLNEDPTDFLMGFHPEDREKTREYMHEISAGEEVDFEVRVNPDENYNRWLLIHGRAFRDDEGNVTRIFGTAQDITERKRAEKSLQQQSESLEDVYEIVSDTDLVLKEKLRRILKVGCDRLGVNAGYVSRVEEDHQIFRAVYDPDGRIEEEQRLPLEKSYCRETITRDAPYTVFEASSEGWQNDPAYEQFGFESYIGKKVSIKEEFMGTVCWVDYEPGKFSDTDRAFVELMTELVGYELEQKLTLEELEQTLGEKETLLKEVHHRVKNNMAVISSMLSMQSAQIEEEAMRAKFEESLSRVKSMAIVHELLYQSEHLEEVQFEPYVDQLLDHLRQTFEPDQLNLTVETSIDDVAVDLDTAIPCGLILTELFSNTLQHAFPGRDRGTVEVRFERYDREYRLSVEDNGVGVPEDFDPQQTDSLGYDLIQALVGSNLQGDLTIDSTEGGGTTVTVQFE